jgi:ribosomal protein L40E
MFCSHCGTELPDVAAYCSKCGSKTVRPPQEAAAGATNSQSAGMPTGVVSQPSSAPAPPARSSGLSTWWYIGLALILAWTYLMAVVAEKTPYTSYFEAQIIGYWLGSLLLPFLIAYVRAGRKSVRDRERFLKWFAVLAIFLPAIALSANRSNKTSLSTSEQVRAIAREAAGKQTISGDGSQTEKEEKEILRTAMSEMIALAKRYHADERCEHIQPPLYSPASFGTKQKMLKTVDSLQQCVAVDESANDQLERVMQQAKARIDNTGWSQSHKQAFWDSFNRGYGRGIKPRQDLSKSEQEWADATLSLYRFAIGHSSEIVAKGEHIYITNDATLTRFNELMQESEVARKKFVAQNENVEKQSLEKIKELGLTPTDVGLKEPEK